MTIQITNVPPVVSDTQGQDNKKKLEVNLKTGQNAGDEVNISDSASFASNLKSSVDSASAAGPAKLGGIKQQVASGNYWNSSKIAEGLLNNLAITNE
ncbi:MAG: flagellar biosynthesis anti-sigma factor FlgM [Deltaproteobacteria bacterium]|jgi:flagellar biosynthesis anti-sigma factor FlgM|nr:flagellar biosynthesis anti-sigma factor FlgM [Deltaproteobacteria bacterium]MCL5880530.1 flagellar biosynthesis anti-sigma factor FlgM [Deltaproteobacteria bacterium]MDA8304046.1 flagellar biosynthesis anti-sigma factor FlgM [Deltaproteobacteria bacterium]